MLLELKGRGGERSKCSWLTWLVEFFCRNVNKIANRTIGNLLKGAVNATAATASTIISISVPLVAAAAWCGVAASKRWSGCDAPGFVCLKGYLIPGGRLQSSEVPWRPNFFYFLSVSLFHRCGTKQSPFRSQWWEEVSEKSDKLFLFLFASPWLSHKVDLRIWMNLYRWEAIPPTLSCLRSIRHCS